MGGAGTRRGGRGRKPLPETPSREGSAGLGEGVVQGRAQDGSEQAVDATGFREAATPLGGRAYFRVNLAQPTMAKDYERLCSAGEAFIHVLMNGSW